MRSCGRFAWWGLLARREARGEKGGLEEQVGEVANRLVSLAFRYLLDNGVVQVQLEGLLTSMYDIDESRSAYAFMIRCILDDEPN